MPTSLPSPSGSRADLTICFLGIVQGTYDHPHSGPNEPSTDPVGGVMEDVRTSGWQMFGTELAVRETFKETLVYQCSGAAY